jgi:hypothetical protein
VAAPCRSASGQTSGSLRGRPASLRKPATSAATGRTCCPAFGNVDLKDLTPLRIKTFVAQLSAERKPATVRHVQRGSRPS